MISRDRVKQAILKQKKRVRQIYTRQIKIPFEDFFNKQLERRYIHIYKTTGKPCNCYLCSKPSYNRKIKHKNGERQEDFI